jgi:hypothetical protein
MPDNWPKKKNQYHLLPSAPPARSEGAEALSLSSLNLSIHNPALSEMAYSSCLLWCASFALLLAVGFSAPAPPEQIRLAVTGALPHLY